MSDTRIVYRARFGVPANGIPIYSESDFDSPDAAKDFLDAAYEEGQISSYEIQKITTTVVVEVLATR